MQLVQTDERFAGKALAEAVVDGAGQVLCRPGTRLTAALLERLRRRGIDVLYVDAPGFEGIDARESVDWPTRARLQAVFTQACAQAAAGGTPHGLDAQAIWAVRDAILAHAPAVPCLLFPRRGLVFDPEEGPRLDPEAGNVAECLAIHCLNTALIIAAAGRDLRLPDVDLPDMVAAALIHDLGMALLPRSAWLRGGPLEEAERALLDGHPQVALDAFSGSLHWNTYLRLAVLQHHERLDGSGYPQGVAGERLHPAVALLIAADIYAALQAPRVHRPAWRPEDVVEMELASAGVDLAADAVRAVVSAVGLYPRGSVVLLGDGRRGVVAEPGQGTHRRPVLRVEGKALDLNAHLNLAIVGVVG